MKQELDESEQMALSQAFNDPVFCSALKKFCLNQESAYTKKVREQTNFIPEDLHQKAKKESLAALYGGMAKAYGTVYAELEKAAGR